MGYADGKAIDEYVGGEIRDARVTVRWLERELEESYSDEEERKRCHFVHVCCEVWADDNEGTMEMPDHWQIDWFHAAGLITDQLKPFLDRWCPFPNRVWEAALEVPLPEELKELFGPRAPRRDEIHDILGYDA